MQVLLDDGGHVRELGAFDDRDDLQRAVCGVAGGGEQLPGGLDVLLRRLRTLDCPGLGRGEGPAGGDGRTFIDAGGKGIQIECRADRLAEVDVVERRLSVVHVQRGGPRRIGLEDLDVGVRLQGGQAGDGDGQGNVSFAGLDLGGAGRAVGDEPDLGAGELHLTAPVLLVAVQGQGLLGLLGHAA